MSLNPRHEPQRDQAAIIAVADWLDAHPDHPLDDLAGAVEAVHPEKFHEAHTRLTAWRKRVLENHEEDVANAKREGLARPDDPSVPPDRTIRVRAAGEALGLSHFMASLTFLPLVRPLMSENGVRGMRAARVVCDGTHAAIALRTVAETGKCGWSTAIDHTLAADKEKAAT